MQKSFYGLMLLGLLACGPGKQSTNEAEPSRPIDSLATARSMAVPSQITTLDTVAPFTKLGRRTDSLGGFPVVLLGGQTYQVVTSAQPDRTKRLLPREPFVWRSVDSAGKEILTPDPVRDSIYEANGYGYDARYTVQLRSADGRRKFTSTLRKTDFAAAMGREHVAQSLVSAPKFLDYLPQFNALAFDVAFILDESDVGGEALLLLDATTGKVKYITEHYDISGGVSADALTPDGRTLLLCNEILHAGSPPTSLLRKHQAVAATLLVNPQTVLAVYEAGYDSKQQVEVPIRGPNAFLLTLNGQQLGSFRFHGTTGGPGYTLNHQYLSQTRTHYLFDDTDNTLRLIPRDQPLRHRWLRLGQLPIFKPPQRAGEVKLFFATESGKELTLYADAKSGSLRYQLAQPE